MNFLSVKGWERFQHYSDRDPTWVKLYRDLLTSESWVLGTDSSRLLQIASILLAARYKNKIPYRWDLIKKVASLEFTEPVFKVAVQHLVESDFLEIQQVTEEVKPLEHSASTALATCSSEKSREEKKREEERRPRDVELKLDDGPIERVFEHWRQEFRHPRATLDPKRRRVIQVALKSYGESTILESLSGYRNSPHHMGQNDQRTVYDDISLFLRDAEHVERGLQFARAPPQPAKSAVELARENLQRSMNGARNGSVVSEQNGYGESDLGSATRVLR